MAWPPVTHQDVKDKIDGIAGVTDPAFSAALNTAIGQSKSPGWSGRSPIIYKDTGSVYVGVKVATLAGFRFMGQPTRTTGPTAALSADRSIVSANTSTDLAGITALTLENWYAVFAAMNTGDTLAVVKTVPFFRAKSVAGSVITLGKAGEGQDYTTDRSYTLANNALVGTEVLVINETINGRGHAFSGRVTTITANTANTVTLSSIGTIAAGDFILPAPPGFDHYGYLGSFYLDTGEIRNISDSGGHVRTAGITIGGASIDGSLAAGVDLSFGGTISPLATGVIVDLTQSFATSSTGDWAFYFGSDGSNHTIHTLYNQKRSASTETFVDAGIALPFAHSGQQLNLKSAGGVHASADRSIGVQGWIEP